MRYSKRFIAGMAMIALGACSTYGPGPGGQQGPASAEQPGAGAEGAGGNFSKNEYPTGSAGMTKDAAATDSKDAKGTGGK